MTPLGAFLALLTAFLALLAATTLVRREPHLGWKRLTLAATPVIAACASGSIAWLAEDDIDAIANGTLTFVVALLATPIVILGGRRCVLWIRRGFAQGEHPARSSAPASEFESTMPQIEGARPMDSATAPIANGAKTTGRSKLIAADFWTRASARSIDLCLVLFLASTLAPMDFWPDIPSHLAVQFLVGKFIWMVWLSIFVIVYDVLFLSMTGRTPGKWILGLEVISAKRTRLSAADVWKRERDLMTFGLYWMLLFPFLQVIGAFRASKDLSKRHATEWDRKLGSAVVQHRIGEIRRAFGVVLATVLLVVVIIGQQIAKEETRYEWRDINFGSGLDLPRVRHAVESRSCKLSPLATAASPVDLQTTCRREPTG